MEKAIKYSVIVPVYNSERTIRKCLISVLKSNRSDVELIVVDDGSVDSSYSIIRDIRHRYSGKVKLILAQEENLGVSGSRNTGLGLASGQYILFLDSDDYVSGDYFDVLDRAGDQELTIFGMGRGKENSMGAFLRKTGKMRDYQQQLLYLLRVGLIHSASNKCFRRDILEKYQIRFQEDLSIGEDFLFSLEYCLHCHRIQILEDCIYRIDCSNLNSLSRGYRPDLTRQLVGLYEALEKVVASSQVESDLKGQLLRELDFYHSKAACTCIAELFKVEAHPFLNRREEIGRIGDLFRGELAGKRGYCSLIHRGLNFMLGHKWILPIYLVTYRKKAKAYQVYRDMRSDRKMKSKILLTFDDGRGDMVSLYRSVLKPNRIPGTFFITAAYNDGSCPKEYSPTSMPPIGIRNLQLMHQDPLVEIGGHGNVHICDLQDALVGEEKLRSWLGIGEGEKIGYSAPNSSICKEELEQEGWKRFLYVRSGSVIRSHKLLRLLCRKAGRVIHLPWLYSVAYQDCLIGQDLDPEGPVPSVCVLKDITGDQVKALVDSAVASRRHLVLMFHSIGDKTGQEDNWTWSMEKFLDLCAYLQKLEREGKIELCRMRELGDGDSGS